MLLNTLIGKYSCNLSKSVENLISMYWKNLLQWIDVLQLKIKTSSGTNNFVIVLNSVNLHAWKLMDIWIMKGRLAIAVADLDLELRGGPGLDLLALLAFFPSVISSFLPKIRGAQAPRAPPLDPPRYSISKFAN